MNHYADPTAAMALGAVNREFAQMERKAKRLCARLKCGEISLAEFQQEQLAFTGIYRQVLKNALARER